MESLKFDDNYFTHSISNLGVFFAKSGGLDATKEIYRTLKPGGIAIVNCWEHITWLAAFFSTNATTRPGVAFPAPPVMWADGKQIKKVVLEAGFKEENMIVEKSEAWAKTTDLRSWAEKSWAFLGGLGGWHEGDEEKWNEAVDSMVKVLMAQPGTKTVGDEVWMKASQWIVIATK
jgi:ubiquinone/menaquinone biosynthesis C-methylase UbiE